MKRETHGYWPKDANGTPAKPIHECPGCGAQSSAPINHDHSQPKPLKRR